jgi:hypothetical protein
MDDNNNEDDDEDDDKDNVMTMMVKKTKTMTGSVEAGRRHMEGRPSMCNGAGQ